MDPVTIGLLISIAPTVLDLLFGHGHHIKDQALIQNLKTMYGYGFEGFGYEGEGYRYPPLSRDSKNLMLTTVQTKRGPIQVLVPKPTRQWAAAYQLNIRQKPNPWVEFMRGKIKALLDEYYKTQLAQPELTEEDRAILEYKRTTPVEKRPRHKRLAAVAKRLYPDLETLPEEQLLYEYYLSPAIGEVHKIRGEKARRKARERLLALAKK
jgi:hypothetical protein